MSFLKEYTLLSELGKGGFAKVYKVRHNDLGYIRAIRVLNETVTDESSPAYQKFLRECKVLLRLGNGSHPNIVHIYQPRLLESHALVEMDYVDGTDLSQYLKENGNFVPFEEVMSMVEQMSSALAYCHEGIYKFCMDREADHLNDDPMDGSKVLIDAATRQRLVDKYKVIHNDIHSGNIMRREDGSFVLLDFGLAITGADDVRNSSRHVNGAVEFKAPEKWVDEALLTEESDIYSFGVVMYEYLTGRVPFPFDKSNPNRTEATFQLSRAHKEQMPPPIFKLRKAYFEAKCPGQVYKKDYPDWLEVAIMRCLAKNPADRFHNGKELFLYIQRQLKEVNDSREALINEVLKGNQQEPIEIEKDKDPKKNEKKSPIINTIRVNGGTTPAAAGKRTPKPKRKPWGFVILLLLGLTAVALLALDLYVQKNAPRLLIENKKLSEKNKSLDDEVEDLDDQLSIIQTKFDEQKKRADGLQRQLNDLQQQLNDLQYKLKKKEEEISKKDKTIGELKAQLDKPSLGSTDVTKKKSSSSTTVSKYNRDQTDEEAKQQRYNNTGME